MHQPWLIFPLTRNLLFASLLCTVLQACGSAVPSQSQFKSTRSKLTNSPSATPVAIPTPIPVMSPTESSSPSPEPSSAFDVPEDLGISLISSATAVTAIETFTILVQFTRAVSVFDLSSLTLENATVLSISGEGSEFVMDVSGVADGLVSVKVDVGAVQDKDGIANRQSAMLAWTLDRTPPAPPVVFPASGRINFPSNATISENASPDPHFAWFRYTIDGSGPSCTNGIQLTGQSASIAIPGAETVLKVVACDSVGNVSSVVERLYQLNVAPTISAIANVATEKDERTDAIPFTIGDTESQLNCTGSYLAMLSSDQSVVSNASVVWGGIFPYCTAVITPVLHAHGSVTVTITVTDPDGGTDSSNFGLEIGTGIVLGRVHRSHPGDIENGFSWQDHLFVVNGKLFVADSSNHRILIWNSIPTVSGQAPDIALGQPDLSSRSANNGALVSAATLSAPSNVYSDGTRLFVSDSGNNRVLIWNAIPTSFAAPADLVLGQPNLRSGAENNGGVSSSSLSYPAGIYSNGTKLFVSDSGNSRVLVWNSIPTTSGVAADLVLGQPSFTTNEPNNGGVSGSSMYGPNGIYSVGTKLFVADKVNNRVLIWNSLPTANGQAANIALGQASLSANSLNSTSASSLTGPHGIFGVGSKLFVADSSRNRVLAWDSLPTANGQAANFAIGKTTLTSGTFSYPLSASKLNIPQAIGSDGTKLFVSDSGASRVLIWNALPSSSGSSADIVLGKSTFTDYSVNNNQPSATNMERAASIHTDGTRLFVADDSWHRVLIWNSLPTYSGQPADVVLGQPNFSTVTSNSGGVSGSSLNTPGQVFTAAGKLFVVDQGNHRVLVWNTVPTSSGVSADYVVGQTTLIESSSGTTSSTLTSPHGVYSDGSRLFVSDSSNHRVLVWNTIPTTSGQAANFALGQPNLTSGVSNNGGISASRLYGPGQLGGAGSKLYVVDISNNRLLGWNSIPSSSGQAANVVIGQPDFTSNTASNGGISANSLSFPLGMNFDGTKLLVCDYMNHRVIVWQSPPSTNGAAADLVLGQANESSNETNLPYYQPSAVLLHANKIYSSVYDSSGYNFIQVMDFDH